MFSEIGNTLRKIFAEKRKI